MSKSLNSRIQYKIDTLEQWNEATFTPLKGELLFYKEEDNFMLKVGDDERIPENLPYVSFGKTVTELKVVTDPVLNIEYVYNGSEQKPEWTYNSEQIEFLDNMYETNAGTYSSLFKVKSGYCWSDGTVGYKSFNWEIKKATPTLTLYIDYPYEVILDTFEGEWVEFNYTGDGNLSCTSDNTDYVEAVISNGILLGLSPIDKGTTTVTLSATGGKNYEDISVTINVTNNVKRLNVSGILDENSWEIISEVSQNPDYNPRSYWEIGDTKKITLNGNIGSAATANNLDFCVYIIDFDHKEGTQLTNNGIQFGTFKEVDVTNMNSVCLVDSLYNSGVNYSEGGAVTSFCFDNSHYVNTSFDWKKSSMRQRLLGSPSPSNPVNSPVPNSLLAAFPIELRQVIKPMTIYYTNGGNVESSEDYLPLLSVFEITNQLPDSIANDYSINMSEYQTQYKFYEEANSNLKYSIYDGQKNFCYWWTRTKAKHTPSTYYSFFTIDTSGKPYSSTCRYSYGVAPIFTV